MDVNTLKPFSRKSFFLDLKNVPMRTKLAVDLELLGGKECPLSKSISFVVSDRVSLNEDQSTSCPTTSDHKFMSFDLFNYRTASPPVRSPANSRPNIMTRNMVILQNAMKQKQEGTSNVMETCKKWNIKIFPVQKVLPWVKKYKSLYSSYYAAEQKKCAKKLSSTNANDGVQKLNGPFLKIEDEAKQFKTSYKEFLVWKKVIEPSLSQSVMQLRANVKVFGNINDSVRPPLREANINSLNLNLNGLNTPSVSLTKISAKSVSNLISAYPANGENKENIPCYPSKRKLKPLTTISKRRYCEVCSTHYSDLEAHLISQHHQNVINKENYFDEVESVISSLPQASDFILKIENENNHKMEQNSINISQNNTEGIGICKEKTSNLK